ncbi:MAG: HpaII family restriction endonuclease [Flavobacterium sp.]|nr:HpaII family restriction endonuclease [Flavobacterium sp.]
MLTGNIGEWSEIYTLLKLLSDGKLIPGDENIEKINNLFYPIIKILRSESNGTFEYYINQDIVIISNDKELLRVPLSTFKDKATFLLEKIKANIDRTFSVPEIEDFMNDIKCITLKSNSLVKTDINIVVHDLRTNQTPLLGFSIKSQLGHPSTLLNAGKTTNFIYKIEGVTLSLEEINWINAIETKNKIRDRITAVLNNGGVFHFEGTEQKIFSNNLTLIDSLLPKILAEILYTYYTQKDSNLNSLVNNIQINNPLAFDTSDNHQFYSYKIKRFLTDVALGMMPSKVWSGEHEATGGYLIVKEDGEILCYHIYNKNEFENYLLNNTKLDTASSKRHEFGKVYLENQSLFFKLNLQIRFIK